MRALVAATLLALPVHAQVFRDSAGVRIVVNTQPAWGGRYELRMAAQPDLVIGNNPDSLHRFRQVRGVMRLTDGRIAVADGRTMQLRFFDSKGGFLSASAGRGREPGQVLNMSWTHRLHGDTIAIGAGFLTVALYSPTGQHVRTTMPVGASGRPPTFMLFDIMSNGFGIAAPRFDPTPRPIGTRWIDSVALKLMTPSGEITRDIGMVAALELEQVASGPTPVWLSPSAVIAAGDDRAYIGFGDRYEIRVFDGDGKLRSIIRRSWTPEPITAADWEHWVVEWSKLWVRTTGAERERDVQRVREEPWAEENPAFSQFIVDRTGRLWVRGAHWQDAIGAGSLADFPAVPSSWSVFDVQGRWLGDVGMPIGFKPFEIGADYVAGVRLTNGMSLVEIYPLTAGVPSPVDSVTLVRKPGMCIPGRSCDETRVILRAGEVTPAAMDLVVERARAHGFYSLPRVFPNAEYCYATITDVTIARLAIYHRLGEWSVSGYHSCAEQRTGPGTHSSPVRIRLRALEALVDSIARAARPR